MEVEQLAGREAAADQRQRGAVPGQVGALVGQREARIGVAPDGARVIRRAIEQPEQPGSSSTATPSDSALVSFEPAFSPATT
jgi:hypothetical protein